MTMSATSTPVSTPTRLLTIRPATPADLPAVAGLLTAAALPTADVAALFAARAHDFLVADDTEQSGALVGVAGLEVCCGESPHPTALLRSVAVRDDWRAHGVGRELVRRLVCVAEARGLRALYLLTMTAEHYFPQFGFQPVARGAVPPEIAATLEFRSACPASAVAMARPLAGVAPDVAADA